MTVNLAIVGLGWIGMREAKLVANRDDATLVGGADTDITARSSFQSSFDLPCCESLSTLLRRTTPDGIIIATPNSAHYAGARRVLEEGIDVLVEKPMVTDVADARKLVRLAKRSNGSLYVGYHRRFHPGFQQIASKLDDGTLGQLYMCDCQLGQNWLEPNQEGWRTGDQADGGGILFDTGSHLLEILFWLLDGTPREVTGLINTRDSGVDIDGGFVTNVDHNRGSTRVVLGFCGDSTGFVPDEHLTLWGTEGRLVYTKEPAGEVPHERLQIVSTDEEVTSWTFHEGTDSESLTDAKIGKFVEAIQSGSTCLTTGQDALDLAAFRAAAIKAAKESTHQNVSEFY